MPHQSKRPLLQLSYLALTLALGGAVTLAACVPPPAPAKEAEDINPPGPLDGVEAEAISSTDGAPKEAEEPATTAKFEDLSPGDKLEWMKTSVAPKMKELFQSYDSEEFAEFGCRTCHGPGARDGNFKMPTASLPALDKAEMDAHPKMSAFMAESVVPQMAQLLGEHVEGDGAFGCFSCHTKKN